MTGTQLTEGAAAPVRLRDAGGIEIGDGTAIRAGHVFRISGQIVTPEQLEALRLAGAGVVVDLRGGREDRSAVQEWAAASGVRYQHEPILAGNIADMNRALRGGSPEEMDAVMRATYLGIVDDHGREIAATLATIAEGSVTGFGCAAGKDRTGIVTALLHALLGAPDAAVAAAYTAGAPSPEQLHPQIRTFLELSEDDELPPGSTILLGTDEAWILAVLAHVRERHRSVAGYLEAHGLGAGTADRLREVLVVEL